MRKDVRYWVMLLSIGLQLLLLTACLPAPQIAPAPTPAFTLSGGGRCVRLGSHPRPPYLNIRVTHDSYAAHSETMLAQGRLRDASMMIRSTMARSSFSRNWPFHRKAWLRSLSSIPATIPVGS